MNLQGGSNNSKFYNLVRVVFRIKLEAGRSPRWYNYALCGFKGIMEKQGRTQPKGLVFHALGTIPPSAGLSSSSALVCAAALSLNVVLNVSFQELLLNRLRISPKRKKEIFCHTYLLVLRKSIVSVLL